MLPRNLDLALELLVAADEMAARGEVADRQPGPQALHLDLEQVVRLVGGPSAPREEVYRFDLELGAEGDVALDRLQRRRIVLAEHRGVHSDFHPCFLPSPGVQVTARTRAPGPRFPGEAKLPPGEPARSRTTAAAL